MSAVSVDNKIIMIGKYISKLQAQLLSPKMIELRKCKKSATKVSQDQKQFWDE